MLTGSGTGLPTGGGLSARLRPVWRAGLVLLFTLPVAAVQAVLITRPGRAKVVVARWYWAMVCRLLHIERRVIGAVVSGGGRPVVFASNHSSWLDILALGGTLPGCFISKEEVGRWPGIRTIARLGRTVYVSRRARATASERDSMRGRLAAGDNLILFPEGTSSDGSRVLPFRSAFFSVADEGGDGARPLIQPVTIVFDRLDGLPVGRSRRAVCAWYGDMDLGGHFLRLERFRAMRATILLHPPVDPAAFASRKALAEAVWRVVADAAATLRQNRPAPPAAGEPQTVTSAAAAFA